MSLLDELKEKRRDAVEYIEGLDNDLIMAKSKIDIIERSRAHWVNMIPDLDRCISALEQQASGSDVKRAVAPPSEFPTLPGGVEESRDQFNALSTDEPAIPEGFTRWDGADVDWDKADEDNFPFSNMWAGSLVEVQTRGRGREIDEAHRFVWDWRRNSTPENNILAYRVISEPTS